MCIAIPGKVIEIGRGEALVDFNGIEQRVNTYLVDDLYIGDYVLVHIGCAIEKINKEIAKETLDILRKL